MKSIISGLGILGMLVFIAAPDAWGQTVGEELTAIEMAEELTGTSTGPSVGGARPASPSPASAPRPVGPAPAMPSVTGPAVSSGPLPSAAGSETTARPGGSSRTVLAPENGFIPTRGAQLANLGFENMQQMRFDEAQEAYRRAKELDSRYEPAYNGIVNLVTNIKQLGVAIMGDVVIAEEPVKVTVGKYFGWSR